MNFFTPPNCWQEHRGTGPVAHAMQDMHSFSGTIELQTFAEGIDRTIAAILELMFVLVRIKKPPSTITVTQMLTIDRTGSVDQASV